MMILKNWLQERFRSFCMQPNPSMSTFYYTYNAYTEKTVKWAEIGHFSGEIREKSVCSHFQTRFIFVKPLCSEAVFHVFREIFSETLSDFSKVDKEKYVHFFLELLFGFFF